MKIYSKTTIALMLVSILPIFIVSIASYYISSRILMLHTTRELELIADTQKLRIENRLDRNREEDVPYYEQTPYACGFETLHRNR
ncbi:secreted protein [Candidatus Magnetobacterium bavaricum]|uniref:Secreted protein n=1 Tax=Candidatus Magnetobacterium bavaricum TaxID=29290 RepID=A0A0F3GXL0_9BACT|nr:secreted protein [Candidatus Magnetobacterium bavaricum]